MTARSLLPLVVLAMSLTSSLAFAQTGAQLRTQVSERQVEVGQTFTYVLTALVDQGSTMPSNPTLKVPPGLSAHGPSVGSQQQISLSGGKFFQRVGISATWTLQASKPGRYQIGPGSVDVGGRRASGDTVEVEVVPAGSGQPRKKFDPFDPFSLIPNLPGSPLAPDDERGEPEVPPFPEELKVQRAEDSLAFLRAVASPLNVVVGEQITLRIFAYGMRGPFRETNTSEPSREAFLAQTLLENSYSEPMYRVPVGGEVWHAKKIRELALFPIKSGNLTVGAMRMGFEGRGYPSSGRNLGLVRYSAPLAIAVSEPPVQGRPAGYKLGDVGRFTLGANVEPREIIAGEAVSVVAKLEGTGNLPLVLKTPGRSGIQWLDPTTVEDIAPRGSVMGGWRKFTFVVRIDESGDIDLGELTLPYWDPERDSYDIARATLGVVKVKPGTGTRSKEPESSDSLRDLLSVRKTLGAGVSSSDALTDRVEYWLLLLLAPIGVVLTSVGARASRRLRERARARRESHSTVASRALADARRAAATPDVKAAAAAAERAILAAIDGSTGLKARAVLKHELAKELEARGISSDLAEQTARLLAECDDARFTGTAEGDGASDLVERASAVVQKLSKSSRQSQNGGA